MLFEALFESAKRGELLLYEGGMCHYHVRRDGLLTIREILCWPPCQGVGSRILERLKEVGRERGCEVIVAKCPDELEANAWYEKKGFHFACQERTQTGRFVNVWRLPL